MTRIDRQMGLAAIDSRSFARDASRLSRLAVEIRRAHHERVSRRSPPAIEVRWGRPRVRPPRGTGTAPIDSAGATTVVMEEER